MKTSKLLLISVFTMITLFLSSCEQIFDTPPTKTSMEGVWTVSKVVNTSNVDITSQVSLPIVAFYLSSDQTVLSTAGPLFMYIVYGQNKYTEIASKIDQVFNYSTLTFNGGEFFVGGGVQNHFTLEMKLEGLPGQKTLTTLLQLIGIGNDYLDVVVWHKFRDVNVTFSNNYREMIWEIDNGTTAVYNTKDSYGDYVSWQGWPVTNFQKCKIYLTKSSVSLNDVVTNAKK